MAAALIPALIMACQFIGACLVRKYQNLLQFRL
jgi:hypothetical protein